MLPIYQDFILAVVHVSQQVDIGRGWTLFFKFSNLLKWQDFTIDGKNECNSFYNQPVWLGYCTVQIPINCGSFWNGTSPLINYDLFIYLLDFFAYRFALPKNS